MDAKLKMSHRSDMFCVSMLVYLEYSLFLFYIYNINKQIFKFECITLTFHACI